MLRMFRKPNDAGPLLMAAFNNRSSTGSNTRPQVKTNAVPRSESSTRAATRSYITVGLFENCIDTTADSLRHADQRRPFAVETFACQFFRRINSQLRADR